MSENLDIFEKLFGKKPEDGNFIFNHLDYCLGWGALVIRWSCQGIGFGEISFIFDPDKGLNIDDECMSKEFVLKAIDEAEARIKKGQKAVRTLFCEKEGVRYEDSKEENELFIKNVLLTFKRYILEGYFKQWNQL